MVKNYRINVNGKSYDVEVEELSSTGVSQQVPLQSKTVAAPVAPQTPTKAAPTSAPAPKASSDAKSEIVAPMAGLVIDVMVKKGQNVNPGDKLLVLEAMKMENDIVSDISGTVDEINCRKGENVETGEILITIV